MAWRGMEREGVQGLGWMSWGSLLGQAHLRCTAFAQLNPAAMNFAPSLGPCTCMHVYAHTCTCMHTLAHVCAHLHMYARTCTCMHALACECTHLHTPLHMLCMAKCSLGTARALHQNIWGCRAGARHWGLPHTPGARRARALPQVVVGVPGPPLGVSTFRPSRCLLSAAGSLPLCRGL